MFRSTVVTALFLLFCFAASGRNFSNQYFPQQVGNEWTYRKTGRLAGEGAGWTNKITQKEGDFFQHSNYWGDGVVRWVRTTANATVVERARGNPPVWYRFANTLQKEWTVQLAVEGPACVNGSTAHVASRNETVQVPAGTFQNCIKLEFRSNCNDAGINEQWFAPGVGLVKQTEDTIGGPLISELVSAKIGTTTYPK